MVLAMRAPNPIACLTYHGYTLSHSVSSQCLMFDVAALENHCTSLQRQSEKNYAPPDLTHLVWTSNTYNLAVTLLQCRLAPTHIFGIAHHEHAHEWIAVPVPPNNRRLILFGSSHFSRLCYCDVDVTQLIINDGYKVNTSNLGDEFESIRVLPCLCDELGVSNTR